MADARPRLRSPRLRPLGGLVALTFALLCQPAGRAAAQSHEPAGFHFALVGDPQLGFGRGGMYGDAGRFAKVVDRINESGVPFAVVPGDLVQTTSLWQRWAIQGGLARFTADVHLTPGNHDVADEASLAAYRAQFGDDYHDMVHGNAAFVFVDSETARAPQLSKVEYEAQWAWLDDVMRRHANQGHAPIFVVTHRPPFQRQEDEPASDANWPIPTRTRLLELMRETGSRHVLAGHLHRTVRAATEDGIQILVSAGSARSYDESPIAYFDVAVEGDQVQPRLVKVAAAPAPAFEVPGFRGWTPRLFDFSVRHWLFTLLFGLTAIAAVRARRALLAEGEARTADARLWRLVMWALVFFGANWQLDVDELLSAVGRGVAKLTGVYAVRHLVTGAGLLAGVVVVLGLAVREFRRSERSRATLVAMLCLWVPGGWFALSVISHHDLGMLFDEALWDLLTLASLATVALCARDVWRRARGVSGSR